MRYTTKFPKIPRWFSDKVHKPLPRRNLRRLNYRCAECLDLVDSRLANGSNTYDWHGCYEEANAAFGAFGMSYYGCKSCATGVTYSGVYLVRNLTRNQFMRFECGKNVIARRPKPLNPLSRPK